MTGTGYAPRRGRPPASDEQRQQQRLDISRHAVRLFAEQGVAATSGEQIARAAGVSERTLWRYFRTKESCVEPLLTKMIDAFRAVLRAWPPELELIEHLRATYTPVFDSAPGTDVEAVLAVIRMTHDEPALRAVYLVLRERSEDTFAEVLAERMGKPPNTFDVRVQAATMNAVLKAATDHLVHATAEKGITPQTLDRHREHIANAISLVTRALSDT
ncbi:AcrR family transcriptional regulator [Kibdelosporangium banguiense]|uniref:AcrR family transcriptional regulator n=1 Tax=Kibdelosporangium banguiense TaxID=1365924 RepID=A0ABS4TU25_9PSEU|nr:helix-turn-helix domain-containing protein [Kibdelosporangium banguiense]MBP2327900.1 AcrR family transcriptional regulator [Kibdelosporangium banguiense]